jgi:hypothetical protein
MCRDQIVITGQIDWGTIQLCMHISTAFAHARIINWALSLVPQVNRMVILPKILGCQHVSRPNWHNRSDWGTIQLCMHISSCTEFAHARIINWALSLVLQVNRMVILPKILGCMHVSRPNWHYKSDWLGNDSAVHAYDNRICPREDYQLSVGLVQEVSRMAKLLVTVSVYNTIIEHYRNLLEKISQIVARSRNFVRLTNRTALILCTQS